MNPLAPDLYSLLNRRLPGGVLRTANVGIAAMPHRTYGLDGRPRLELVVPGEEYICFCPFCGDSSGHLYINHLFGQFDEHTGKPSWHLAKCFRRSCLSRSDNREQLINILFGIHGYDRRRPVPWQIRPGQCAPTDPTRLSRVEPPGQLIPVNQLYDAHAARLYLRDRGYDLDELSSVWGISLCVEPCTDDSALGRIFIPMVMHGELVAWQTRYPGELDWKATHIRKYLNMRWMPKRLLLYNFDRARTQPFVCLMEGVTDVWALGDPGVALLGKTITEQQVQLVAATWKDKPVVILLDGDDPDAVRAAEDMRLRLLMGGVTSPLVQLALPDGKDPGETPRRELRDFIQTGLTERGIKLQEELAC